MAVAKSVELTLTHAKDTNGKTSGGHRVFTVAGNGISYGSVAFPKATAPDSENPGTLSWIPAKD